MKIKRQKEKKNNDKSIFLSSTINKMNHKLLIFRFTFHFDQIVLVLQTNFSAQNQNTSNAIPIYIYLVVHIVTLTK